MKKIILATSFALLANVASADGFTRIMTKAEFSSIFVGFENCDADGCSTLTKNGRIVGVSTDGAKISGRWSWKDGFYCRGGKVGNKRFKHDCLTVEVSQKKSRWTKKKGKGTAVEIPLPKKTN